MDHQARLPEVFLAHERYFLLSKIFRDTIGKTQGKSTLGLPLAEHGDRNAYGICGVTAGSLIPNLSGIRGIENLRLKGSQNLHCLVKRMKCCLLEESFCGLPWFCSYFDVNFASSRGAASNILR